MEAKVLVVDDERNILDLVATALNFNGFEVTTARSGREARSRFEAARPDLVVLDVMLPDADGFALCREFRAESPGTAVVFLTAKDTSGDAVTGLTYGGDDYIAKPFAVDELVARVRAVLRRTRPAAAADPQARPGLRVGDLELDDDRREVRRGGQVVPLSPTEFRLLRYLMSNPGRVLSRAQILDAVWSYDFRGEEGIVDQYVSYLRRKLHRHGPPVLQTRRGFGYLLDGAGR